VIRKLRQILANRRLVVERPSATAGIHSAPSVVGCHLQAQHDGKVAVDNAKAKLTSAGAAKRKASQPVQSKPPAARAAAIRPNTAASIAQDDTEIVALDLKSGELSPAMQAYFAKCQEKLGFVPNVLKAYAFDTAKLEAFVAMYNDLMLAPSGLSKLEREMIAVAVSSQNQCYYCLTAHGAAVRTLSGDPGLGELIVMNYRNARLSRRQRAMLDFAVKLTVEPWTVEHEDRERLRGAGFSERDIWDISAVASFFNMSNRVAAATDMRPNTVYHGQGRT
jgi:uncharacterized peroxidase-related enzyme